MGKELHLLMKKCVTPSITSETMALGKQQILDKRIKVKTISYNSFRLICEWFH